MRLILTSVTLLCVGWPVATFARVTAPMAHLAHVAASVANPYSFRWYAQGFTSLDTNKLSTTSFGHDLAAAFDEATSKTRQRPVSRQQSRSIREALRTLGRAEALRPLDIGAVVKGWQDIQSLLGDSLPSRLLDGRHNPFFWIETRAINSTPLPATPRPVIRGSHHRQGTMGHGAP